ncbi:MAG: phytochelatin synthase family protein [Coleofasciculaceae cyanobacterium]
MKVSTRQISLLNILGISLRAFTVGLCLTSGGVLAQTLPLATNLINLNSSQGEQLLLTSQARKDYLPLTLQFVTQDNLAYCGVASIVMVLNALSIPAPEAAEFPQYNIFTQENFFNERAKQVLSPEVVAQQGMTLEQLGQLLESYPVQTEVYHGADLTLEKFRSLVVKNLQESGNFVLANYLRRTLGQEAGGHISPIAAYNEATDRFLILDVSRYKYPPIWVEAEELWQAIRTVDSTSGKTRGLVLVNRGRG